jgi:hypothetical protein
MKTCSVLAWSKQAIRAAIHFVVLPDSALHRKIHMGGQVRRNLGVQSHNVSTDAATQEIH